MYGVELCPADAATSFFSFLPHWKILFVTGLVGRSLSKLQRNVGAPRGELAREGCLSAEKLIVFKNEKEEKWKRERSTKEKSQANLLDENERKAASG